MKLSGVRIILSMLVADFCLVLVNARLFEELQFKSRLLAVKSPILLFGNETEFLSEMLFLRVRLFSGAGLPFTDGFLEIESLRELQSHES